MSKKHVPKKQTQNLPPPEPVSPIRQALGCPTPQSKLVICPTCGHAEWVIPVQGMQDYHRPCDSRMREATKTEYAQVKEQI